MMRFHKILTAVSLVLSVLMTGCTTEADQQLYAGQEKLIEEMLAAQLKEHPEFIVTSHNGAERLTVKEGSGEELGKDGTVSFYYAGYVLSREGTTRNKLFSTNHKGLAEQEKWEVDSEDVFEVVELSLKKDKVLDGLKRGLSGVKAGEECFILFTTEYAFGAKKMNGIPINSGLIYHLWIENVSNE